MTPKHAAQIIQLWRQHRPREKDIADADQSWGWQQLDQAFALAADALLAASQPQQEKNDLSRSDQPQLRAGESDQRDGHRDGK